MSKDYEDMNGPDDGVAAVVPPVEAPVDPPADPPVDPVDPPADPPIEDPEPKKKPGSQREREKRIALETEVRMLREQIAGGKPAETPKPEGKPTPEQFTTHEEYIESLTDWKVAQALQTREAEQKKNTALSGWEAKKEAARDKYEDFDEVLESANASPVVLQVMLESDLGADLGYYLASHPKELKEINSMGTRAATHALDALEERLKEPKPKPISKAPAPLVPLTPSASALPVVNSRFEDF